MPTAEYRQIDSRRDQVITDSNTGEIIGIRSDQGAQTYIKPFGTTVTGSRTLVAGDVEQVLDVTAAATLTIPKDTVLGINGSSNRVCIAAYQAGTGQVTFAAGSGVTLNGNAPTVQQYNTIGIMHVGLNSWSYL